MAWIKRNLPFLIGSVAAVLLLGLAGWYCYGKWSLNKASLVELNQAYENLERITRLNPNPGNEKIDNIRIAAEHRTNVLKVVASARKYCEPVQPIPDTPEVRDRDFAQALRDTISNLRQSAQQTSVTLPPDYDFTFKAQQGLAVFAPGSPPVLAARLGQVNAVCDVLFKARINSLHSILREQVSIDDQRGGASYLAIPSITNEFAVLTPYQITFFCFSPELAGVLSGFASSSHGFVVHSVNVEAGATASATEGPAMAFAPVAAMPAPVFTPAPMAAPSPVPPGATDDGGTAGTGLTIPIDPSQYESPRNRAAAARRAQPAPTAPVLQPIVTLPGASPTWTPGAPAMPGATGTKGLPVEKQLKVTMLVYVVNLLPAK